MEQGRNPKSSISLTDLRTPIVENFLNMLPMGHEKGLKYAFYNVLALVLSTFVILAFWAVYCILDPFIKPLLWALLVGSVLHPFKANLSALTRSWLRSVKRSPTPFALHILTTPIKIADSFSDQVGIYVWSFWKSILGGIGIFFLSYIVYYNPPLRLVSLGQWLVTSCFELIRYILLWVNWRVVFTLNVVYFGYIIHFMLQRSHIEATEQNNLDKTLPQETDENDSTSETNTNTTAQNSETSKFYIKALAYLTWSITFSFICLQLPYSLLLALVVFVILGVVTYFRADTHIPNVAIPTISKFARMVVLNIGSAQRGAFAFDSSKIISPRRKSLTVTPRCYDSSNQSSPETTADMTSPAAESSRIAERQKLSRSFSEGSGHSIGPTRPKEFGQKLETNLEDVSDLPSPIYSEADVDGAGSDEVEGTLIDTNKFLYAVLCACIVVQVWNRLWLLHLLPIPVVYYGIKQLCSKFGIKSYINDRIRIPFRQFYFDRNDQNSDQLFPSAVRVCFRILVKADKKIVSVCEAYLDPVVTIVVLVLVVIGTILGLIFAATQVYAEGDHLVRVGVNLINSTVSQHPEINKVLPEGWQGIMDSMAGNAYLYGRESITNMIRDSISEKNPAKAEQIEKQVIELWDRIYLAWNQTWDTGKDLPKVGGGDDTPHPIEWDDLLERGKEMPDLLELSVLTNYAKENVGTIWTIMESLWNILVANISLFVSALTALISLLFGGGTAILNLLLNLVVFFTALFYLLSSSTGTYKPIDMFNRWTSGGGASSHASNFALAVEEAVNSVFTASFKMAAFYGMWTWLIHTLFQVNIVFVPSIFATIFGAVPFLAPYWAAFPAVLELWLIQGHWPKAILMLLAQMAPMSIVDTQIYSEIKGGGHPYLTGLAVAGGIFCFGFQGAIMGPLVLCCFFVAVKVGSSFMREGSDSGVLESSSLSHRLASQSQSHHKRTKAGSQHDGSFNSSST